jgi:hypothetical protein
MKPYFTQPQSLETIKRLESLSCNYWPSISKYQQLSEPFIREFHDKVYWPYISCFQQLSEDFIREFKDEVDWSFISQYQKLSEPFIREFKNRVDWIGISFFQQLSEPFIKEFHSKINHKLLPNKIDSRSDEEKLEEIKFYAENYNLKFDGEYLYAFRNHENNRGIFGGYYPTKGIYKDWKCDLNPYEENSYGFGIFPKGNTPVRVHYKWWGTIVNYYDKARVWAFEMI